MRDMCIPQIVHKIDAMQEQLQEHRQLLQQLKEHRLLLQEHRLQLQQLQLLLQKQLPISTIAAASGGASVKQENASTKSSASVQDFDIDKIMKMVEEKPVRLSILAKDYQKTYGHTLVYEGKLKQTLCEKLIEGEIQGYGFAGKLGEASFGRLDQLGDLGTITDEKGEIVTFA